MIRFDWQRRLVTALLPFVAACGSSLHSSKPASVAAPASAVTVETETPPQAAAPVEARNTSERPQDPVEALIAASDRHFKAGQTELNQGHFDAAKQAFD